MTLRWYSTVVDSRDVAALSAWWAETLGWQVAFSSEDEVVLVPGWLTAEEAEKMAWEKTGPGLVFVPVPEAKTVKNRLHIDLAPHVDDDRDGLIEQLLRRGASRADVGQGQDVSWTVLQDPEGNEFCVLSSRPS
jgi:hypothetical protein